MKLYKHITFTVAALLLYSSPGAFSDEQNGHSYPADITGSIYTASKSDIEALKAAYHERHLNQLDDENKFWTAYLAYRSTHYSYANQDKKALKRALKQCTELMGEIEQSSIYFPEASIIRALCLGQTIAMQPLKGMLLGQKAGAAANIAAVMGKDNPHVIFLLGVNDYYTPNMWGGDKARAVTRFLDVVQRAESSSAGQWCWLLPDVYTYLALSYNALEQPEKAKAALQKAESLSPQYAFMKSVQIATEE